jgi:hypothetical protein
MTLADIGIKIGGYLRGWNVYEDAPATAQVNSNFSEGL